MGEQYVDLFAAGAYALEAKLLEALAQPALAWIFYVLAAVGIVVSVLQSVFSGDVQLWIRHLATVSVASVLILLPHPVELANLTYAAPGVIETLFGTRTGAAPHLTYLVERFGTAVAGRVRDLMHTRPILTVPSVASQVEDLASDASMLEDLQVKANLQIWRECIVPWLLDHHPDFAEAIRERDLMLALMNPAPSSDTWVGPTTSRAAAAVRALLSASGVDLAVVIADQSVLLRQITDIAGAAPWIAGSSSIRIQATSEPPPTPDPPINASPAYYDAVSRGVALAQAMIDQLPEANRPIDLGRIEHLHDILGRSLLYAAAINYLRDEARLATLGSYCQRLSEIACRSAQVSLVPVDRYNSRSFTTGLKQPLATTLLAVAALLLGALASLVVAVLPFLLGVAKALAILLSSIGVWMLLWPGRLRDALSWMVFPVAFVALWGILFNLWAEVESFLTAIGSVVGHSDYASLSAGRIMSIAISVGYLGLPAIALSILSGNALRALNHASARVETALLMGWRIRRTVMSSGRRWLANSPLARRWNQRLYRSVGLGALRRARALGSHPVRASKGSRVTAPTPAKKRPNVTRSTTP